MTSFGGDLYRNLCGDSLPNKLLKEIKVSKAFIGGCRRPPGNDRKRRRRKYILNAIEKLCNAVVGLIAILSHRLDDLDCGDFDNFYL